MNFSTAQNCLRVSSACWALVVCLPAAALAEPPETRPETRDSATRAAAAIDRGLPIVRRAAQNYPEHRKCFSCHHQMLPMLAVSTAQSADDELLAATAEFTHRSLSGDVEKVRDGGDVGGRELTVSYGLWALKLADHKPDETTTEMVAYLLKKQRDDGHWEVQTGRPPLEESFETSTALAIAALQNYATREQREAADAAIAKAKTWFSGRTGTSQEDRVFRLWALARLSASEEDLNAARRAVLDPQRADGGWAQLDAMESDAYATGETLYVLRATGFEATEPAIERGVEFLLKTQEADGSWRVKSRSKPIQVYFDNGDPHGRDQFISTPATCWALAALGLVK